MTFTPYLIIMIICFPLGYLAGIIMHRSDYCIAGMFRDLFLFKNTFMMRTLLLLVVSTMILFELARQTGLLPLYPFPLLYSPTPANLLGGALFGIGMVLAGGCVVGTLYKMGAGSVLSAVAFAGMIIGSALYAEIHPQWAAFIKSTTLFTGRITLPQILGVSPFLLIAPLAAGGTFFLLRCEKRREAVPSVLCARVSPAMEGRSPSLSPRAGILCAHRHAAGHHILLCKNFRLYRRHLHEGPF